MSMKTASLVEESISVKELYVGGHLLQAGRTGRPAEFYVKNNVKLGGWFNASKSYMDCDSTGTVTGRLSAHNMELRMPNSHVAWGAYSCAEHNIVFQASSEFVNGTPLTFAHYEVSGTQSVIDTWEDNANAKGAVFSFDGLTSGDGSIFETEAPAAADACLAILVNGTKYWLSLSSAHD